MNQQTEQYLDRKITQQELTDNLLFLSMWLYLGGYTAEADVLTDASNEIVRLSRLCRARNSQRRRQCCACNEGQASTPRTPRAGAEAEPPADAVCAAGEACLPRPSV